MRSRVLMLSAVVLGSALVLSGALRAAGDERTKPASSVSMSAPPAGKQRYTLFIYESPSEHAKRALTGEAAAAYWGPYMTYTQQLTDAGVMVPAGCCLAPDSASRVVRTRNTQTTTVVGTHAPGRDGDILGGYFVIDVAGIDEALSWAAKAPNASTGAVEVRPSVVPPMPTKP